MLEPQKFSHTRVLVLLIVLWAVAYLPQLGARSLRLEEGRRATPAREMLATGDWVVPRLYGDVYLNKPPLYFWLVATTGAVTGGVDEFAVRFPAALGVLLAALAMYIGAPRAFNHNARALAALFGLATLIMLVKGPLGEIESFFVFLLIATTLAIWHAIENRSLALWLLAGLFMGAANLTKGPVGLLQVYLVLLPLLIATGRWRKLLSLGHALYLLLGFAPVVLWVIAIHHRTGLTYAELASLWSGQMGVKAVGQVAREPKNFATYLNHYWQLPFECLITALPAVIWAIAAFVPAERRLKQIPRDMWLFFGSGAVALLLPFWLWPTAESRHVIFFYFPIVMLAALYLALAVGDKTPEKQLHLARTTAVISAGLAGAAGVAIAVLGVWLNPLTTTLVAVSACVLGIVMFRRTKRGNLADTPVVSAAAIAAAMLICHGCFVTVFNPWQAPRDRLDIARRQLQQLIPANTPVFTTRSFAVYDAVTRAPKGDGYYNTQFYLPTDTRGLRSLDQLPAARPCIIVIAPAELPTLRERAPAIEVLGEMRVEKGPAPLVVTRLNAQ